MLFGIYHDQVQHLDDNRLSLTYLTIVGAYIVKGSSHDVTTLVDLAIVDPATRSLILRAGGTDTREGTSTLIGQQRESRNTSARSFDAATVQLMDNFDTALMKFESDVRAGKANVRVSRHGSPTATEGGGSSSWTDVLVLMVLALAAAGLRKLHTVRESRHWRLVRTGCAEAHRRYGHNAAARFRCRNRDVAQRHCAPAVALRSS